FNTRVCVRCRSADLLLDKKSGDVICNECGVIVCGRIIDEGNEVRNYGNDDDKPKVSRTSGFSESVGCLQTSFVTRCEETKRSLERAQAFSTPVEEQHVMRNMGSVSEMCGRLELVPCIKSKAIDIFTRTMQERLVKSKSKEPIIVACIYLACRMEKYPRTLDELAACTGIPVRTINTMQQIIRENLRLQIGPLRPEQLVGRMISRLKYTWHVRQCAEEMCSSAACEHVLEGTPPQVTAAMTIVVAALLAAQSIEVEKLTSVAGLSFTRVQIVYKKIYPVLSAVIPEKFTRIVKIADLPS
ncbi:hypothetical protein B484DRAFT_310696, partial [Ochromonadaceae sp. CCMP2298]